MTKGGTEMNCQECNQRPATIHLTQMFNGKKEETHLCEYCAAKKGAMLFNADEFSIPNLLGSFLGYQVNLPGAKEAQTPPNICTSCGSCFADITKTGKLGCADCYNTFVQELEPTLRRIHGNSQHIGKIPARGGGKVLIKKQIEKLKEQLQEAVASEKYELAAEIRDSIKNIEKELG